MRKITQKLKRIMLFALAFAMLVPTVNGLAATQRQKAVTAYQKYLSQSQIILAGEKVKSSNTKFAVADLNGDGTPEMVIQKKIPVVNRGAFAVFTYSKGKIVRVMNGNDYEGFLGYYAGTGVVRTRDYPPMGKNIYYNEYFSRLEGVRTITLLKKEHSVNPVNEKPIGYYFSGRYNRTWKTNRDGNLSRTTRSKFAQLLKKCTISKGVSKFKFYSNTAANRQKYCK
ncbi:MAG TPA: hypothetical protein DCF49_06145 [Lachnospiraceae bacterium]|nr:hypothetical protein [Lachnospiraceae bacterium]